MTRPLTPNRRRAARRRTRRFFFGALVGSLAAVSPAIRADGPKDAPPPSSRTFALLIGCTEYPEFRKSMPNPAAYRSSIALAGCVNDVALMRRTLTERFGASPENITTLAGWPDDAHESDRPTEGNVRAALKRLAAGTYAKGDRVIIHYSGHGVQQPDENGDESDGLDESWLLADGRALRVLDSAGKRHDDYAGTMRDDEIGKWLRAIRDRGASVWCVMDCCHSATGMRGVDAPETRTRGLDPAVAGIELSPAAPSAAARVHQDSPMDDSNEGSDDLVVFYAAQSFQKVPEIRLPDDAGTETSYGLLTSAVTLGLRRSGGRLTFAELFEQVVAGYRDLGAQNQVQPLSEGDVTTRVIGEGKGPSTLLFVRKGDGGLQLSGGTLAGLTTETELDVFAPGRGGDAGHRLGRVVLSDVRAESSVARPVIGTDAAWATEKGPWPAQIATLAAGDTSLPLAWVDEGGKPVEFDSLAKRAREILGDEAMRARFPSPKNRSRAKWLVVVDEGGEPSAITPAARGRGAPWFEVSSQTLESTLLSVFRGENLLNYSARDPGSGELPENLRLRIRRRTDSGELERVVAGQRITPGSRLDFELQKDSASSPSDVDALDVFVFWIDPHFGVDMLYPAHRGDTGRLGAGDVSRKGRTIRVGGPDGELTTDTSQGEERILVFAAPRRIEAPPLDLEFLEQDPLKQRTRGTESDEMTGAARLLKAVAFGPMGSSRGVERESRTATRLYSKTYTFQTRWNALHAPADAEDQPSVRLDRPPTAAASEDSPPDAWRIGPNVKLARAGRDRSSCLLVAQEDGAAGATNILVDLDGEIPADQRTKEDLSTLVAERRFDAELAVRLEIAPKRTIVWYDSDHDGQFDRILVDADDDLRAETRWRLADGKWGAPERGIDLDLLNTRFLPWLAGKVRSEAVSRLRAIAGD